MDAGGRAKSGPADAPWIRRLLDFPADNQPAAPAPLRSNGRPALGDAPCRHAENSHPIREPPAKVRPSPRVQFGRAHRAPDSDALQPQRPPSSRRCIPLVNCTAINQRTCNGLRVKRGGRTSRAGPNSKREIRLHQTAIPPIADHGMSPTSSIAAGSPPLPEPSFTRQYQSELSRGRPLGCGLNLYNRGAELEPALKPGRATAHNGDSQYLL